jgi:hypothetical protein
MNLVHRTRRMAPLAAALAMLFVAQPSFAQDIAASHLAAARKAISAMRATEHYDDILPGAAQALKNELIQKNPDLQSAIIEIVDQQALSLASRRGDLEGEIAVVYAEVFSEDNLNVIATFYQSEAGIKLIESGPILARQIVEAADIWQRGVARDLAQQVGAILQERYGNADAGTEGEAAGGEAAEGEAAGD